jgi:hypothetical protein
MNEPLDPLLERAVVRLRTEELSTPAARARIIEAARRQPVPGRTLLGWWQRPASWSRLGLAAGGIVLLLGGMGLGSLVSRTSAPLAAGSAAAPLDSVRFALIAPDAGKVFLVGDFNGWDPTATPLVRRGEEWTTAVPLAPGRHIYGFVVDGGEWIPDPSAPSAADDDFGLPNSVVFVHGVS